MPTPAQVSWEAWASVAMGAKGIVFFCYSQIPEWANTLENPPPSGSSWAYKKTHNTGSFPGLASFPAYTPGPQLLQLQNKTIPDIKSIESILLATHTLINSPPKPTPVTISSTRKPGDYINFLGGPGGSLYVAVVSSPQRTSGSVTLSLNKNYSTLVPQGHAPALRWVGKKAILTLPPGGGAVYQVMGKATAQTAAPAAAAAPAPSSTTAGPPGATDPPMPGPPM